MVKNPIFVSSKGDMEMFASALRVYTQRIAL